MTAGRAPWGRVAFTMVPVTLALAVLSFLVAIG